MTKVLPSVPQIVLDPAGILTIHLKPIFYKYKTMINFEFDKNPENLFRYMTVQEFINLLCLYEIEDRIVQIFVVVPRHSFKKMNFSNM